jgi:uncharacterized HAD superfamily protein
MPLHKKKGRKYFSFDIDGVISDYPKCWIDFINERYSTKYLTKHEAKESLGLDEYSLCKDVYRKSDYKENLPLKANIREVIGEVRKANYCILISTSRPFDSYPRLENSTRTWLERNKIDYDHLIQKKIEEVEKYSNIEYHVDDELKFADIFLQNGAKVLLLDRSVEDMRTSILRIHSLMSILDYI